MEVCTLKSLLKMRVRGTRLYVYLGWRLALAAALPVVLVVAYLTHVHGQYTRDTFARALQASVRTAGVQVEDFVAAHVAAIETLAGGAALAERLDTAALTPLLVNVHARYPGFLTMIAADAQGRLIAAQPGVDWEGRALLDTPVSIGDREYFQVAMRERRSFVSDVFQGRGFGRDPIVAISAPILAADGTARGIVEGSLNLAGLQRFDTFRIQPDDELLVLDRRDRVVYAHAVVDAPLLSDLSSHPAVQALRSVPAGTSIAVPATGLAADAGTELLSRHVIDQGWQVVGVRSLAPLFQDTRGRWLINALLVAAALLAATAIALVVARHVTGPLTDLGNRLERLDPRREEQLPEVPRAAPLEVQQLFGAFRDLVQRLRYSFDRLSEALHDSQRLRSDLERTVDQRDHVIEVRTRALKDKTEQLRTANIALERLAREDPLTGVANRRAFDEFFSEIWRVCQRESEPVALIMIDVDHFKAYNDLYGHQAGDQALVQVARQLRRIARRPLDLAARYGGEEFVVALARTDRQQAVRLAGDLHASILALDITHERGEAGGILTVSQGVALISPADGGRPAQLIAAADAALYRAKEQGRNRWEVAD